MAAMYRIEGPAEEGNVQDSFQFPVSSFQLQGGSGDGSYPAMFLGSAVAGIEFLRD
jgi:hypothetical protein